MSDASSEERADKKKWYIPDHGVTQLAGNIGFISQGVGYRFFGDKFQSDLMYGFIHERQAGITIHHITQKNTYRPWKWDISPKYSVIPLTAGLHFCYKVGNNNYGSWLFLPERYPDKYYLPTTVHVLPSLGSSLRIDRSHRHFPKRVEVYYEVGSMDMYIVHLLKNDRHLNLSDIVNLAFGIIIRI